MSKELKIRCFKCNGPFLNHHRVHIVEERKYHTGCKPRHLLEEVSDGSWRMFASEPPKDCNHQWLPGTVSQCRLCYTPKLKDSLETELSYCFEGEPDKDTLTRINNFISNNFLEKEEINKVKLEATQLGHTEGWEQGVADFKEELRSKVEGFKDNSHYNHPENVINSKGYNQAVQDILELIK